MFYTEGCLSIGVVKFFCGLCEFQCSFLDVLGCLVVHYKKWGFETPTSSRIPSLVNNLNSTLPWEIHLRPGSQPSNENYTSCNNFLTMSSKLMKIVGPKSYSSGTCCVKFSKKKNRFFVCST